MGRLYGRKNICGVKKKKKALPEPQILSGVPEQYFADRDCNAGDILFFAGICIHSHQRKNQGTEFFPYRVLYTEYSLRCSHQCDLFRNLRPEPGTFKQFLKFVPGRRGSHSLAGQPEAGNLQRGHCHGMAGRRILYGNVYGKYGECAGEPL